jgi:hypothetical protein
MYRWPTIDLPISLRRAGTHAEASLITAVVSGTELAMFFPIICQMESFATQFGEKFYLIFRGILVKNLQRIKWSPAIKHSKPKAYGFHNL